MGILVNISIHSLEKSKQMLALLPLTMTLPKKIVQ